MPRKRTILSQAQKNERQAVYGSCRDGATKTRYQVVWLYANGRSVAGIRLITPCVALVTIGNLLCIASC